MAATKRIVGEQAPGDRGGPFDGETPHRQRARRAGGRASPAAQALLRDLHTGLRPVEGRNRAGVAAILAIRRRRAQRQACVRIHHDLPRSVQILEVKKLHQRFVPLIRLPREVRRFTQPSVWNRGYSSRDRTMLIQSQSDANDWIAGRTWNG